MVCGDLEIEHQSRFVPCDLHRCQWGDNIIAACSSDAWMTYRKKTVDAAQTDQESDLVQKSDGEVCTVDEEKRLQ